MRKILETSTEHIDEIENTQSVDVYFVDDDGEEGTVACEVCLDTGKAFYKDNIYRSSRKVKEAIEEIRKTIVKKKPSIIVKVARGCAKEVGGCVKEVNSSVEIDFILVEFDTNGTDEGQLTSVPHSNEDAELVYSIVDEYKVEVEVDEERVDQLLKIIKG
jgi:hypothetical protein